MNKIFDRRKSSPYGEAASYSGYKSLHREYALIQQLNCHPADDRA